MPRPNRRSSIGIAAAMTVGIVALATALFAFQWRRQRQHLVREAEQFLAEQLRPS